MERLQRALETLDDQLGRGDNESEDMEGEEPTGYCPWSKRGYLWRTSSFHWSWANRQPPIDIITSARYGWRGMRDQDTIACGFCQTILFLPWCDEMLDEAKTIVASEYFVKISDSAHSDYCPWRTRPCYEDIRFANYKSPQLEKALLLKRYSSLRELHINAPNHEPFDDVVLRDMGIGGNDDTNSGALCLAMMQWKLANSNISCRFGCNSIPLSSETFHPQENHAWYCPFMQSGGQDGFLSTFSIPPSRQDYYPLLSRFTSEQIREILAG